MPKKRPSGDADAETVPVVINKKTLALTLVEILQDVIFPSNLTDAITILTEKVERLTNELSTKEGIIKKPEQRVDQLEEAADSTEQYSRRPNLRVHGIPETKTDDSENTDQLIAFNYFFQLR